MEPRYVHNKQAPKVHSVPEFTDFPHRFFAFRSIASALRCKYSPANRYSITTRKLAPVHVRV
jgi:hypothetical protein